VRTNWLWVQCPQCKRAIKTDAFAIHDDTSFELMGKCMECNPDGWVSAHVTTSIIMEALLHLHEKHEAQLELEGFEQMRVALEREEFEEIVNASGWNGGNT
jgi:hypothetical protein